MPEESPWLVEGMQDRHDDPKEVAKASAELARRCNDAGISFEERDEEEGPAIWAIALPCGRDKRWVSAYRLRGLKRLLAAEFEKYIFLADYAAICSYRDGTIEACLRGLGSPARMYSLRRLLRNDTVHGTSGEISTAIAAKDPDSGVTMCIGPSSKDLEALSQSRLYGGKLRALKITGITVDQHDSAVSALERLSNSFFFQLDLLLNIPLTLLKEVRAFRRGAASQVHGGLADMRFPTREYDEAPLALYWYARSATGMPLLQFLAYYQVIEFYFPTYSQADARRRVANLLKDPAFRPDHEADVARVLTAIKTSGTGFGDERSQLRATIQECTDPSDLRDFCTATPERSQFFSSKAKGLTSVKLSIPNTSADLRGEVAERIYDIRCRIVHTKSGQAEGDFELLLPFSREAELLYHDIDLAQYLARRTLVSASSPMRRL